MLEIDYIIKNPKKVQDAIEKKYINIKELEKKEYIKYFILLHLKNEFIKISKIESEQYQTLSLDYVKNGKSNETQKIKQKEYVENQAKQTKKQRLESYINEFQKIYIDKLHITKDKNKELKIYLSKLNLTKNEKMQLDRYLNKLNLTKNEEKNIELYINEVKELNDINHIKIVAHNEIRNLLTLAYEIDQKNIINTTYNGDIKKLLKCEIEQYNKDKNKLEEEKIKEEKDLQTAINNIKKNQESKNETIQEKKTIEETIENSTKKINKCKILIGNLENLEEVKTNKELTVILKILIENLKNLEKFKNLENLENLEEVKTNKELIVILKILIENLKNLEKFKNLENLENLEEVKTKKKLEGKSKELIEQISTLANLTVYKKLKEQNKTIIEQIEQDINKISIILKKNITLNKKNLSKNIAQIHIQVKTKEQYINQIHNINTRKELEELILDSIDIHRWIISVIDDIKEKNEVVNLETLLNLYKKQKDLKLKIDSLRQVNNLTNKPIIAKGYKPITGIIEKDHINEKDENKSLEENSIDKDWKNIIKSLEIEYKNVYAEYKSLMLKVPNIILDEVPIGKSDEDNIEWKKWGTIPKFNFTPKSHIELGKSLNIIDFEPAVNISSTKQYILKGLGTMLEIAVLQFALKSLIDKGFTPYTVPLMVKNKALEGTGYFPGNEEQTYYIEKDNLYLVGTSEVSLCAMHESSNLNYDDLPIKMVSLSNCFRREAGTYGKESQGLYRIHQFQKVEQVIITKNDPVESEKMHFELLNNSEEIVQKLKLPYRVVKVCSGDLGSGQVIKHDIETWMPSRDNYGETHSCSSFYDFQTRRLKIRYKDSNNNIKYAYSLNNTAIASPRILIAILENYQQNDGSVIVPEILRPFMDGIEIIK